MSYPSAVELCEVGPRDGFQFEEKPIPTEKKLQTIRALVEAGVPRIQVTSFVHPKWVPQMADAEELVAQLPERDDVVFTGLALNQRGLERAHAAGLTYVDLSIAMNETHAQDNTNMSVAEAMDQARGMVEWAREREMQPQLGLQTVWGYAEPDDTPLEQVLEAARTFAAMGVESISLADSTGMASRGIL